MPTRINELLSWLEATEKQELLEVSQDLNAKAYQGYTIVTKSQSIIYREAKATPIKIGYFVTLWKADKDKKTGPYCDKDAIDRLIIAVQKERVFSFFIFTKDDLLRHNLIGNATQSGKRGFRIYLPTDNTNSKQAKQSQQWQANYHKESLQLL